MQKRAENFEQAIRRLSASVTEAFNRGDVKSCAQYYTEDALMFLSDRSPIEGRDAIEAVLLEFSAAGMKLGPLQALQIRSSGDLGYCAGVYRFAGTGTEAAVETGKFITVFLRQADGSWKAALDSLMRDGKEIRERTTP